MQRLRDLNGSGEAKTKIVISEPKSDTSAQIIPLTDYAAKSPRANTIGCRGIGYESKFDRWRAEIHFQRKRYYLGTYKNKDDAIKARQRAGENLYGAWQVYCYPQGGQIAPLPQWDTFGEMVRLTMTGNLTGYRASVWKPVMRRCWENTPHGNNCTAINNKKAFRALPDVIEWGQRKWYQDPVLRRFLPGAEYLRILHGRR